MSSDGTLHHRLRRSAALGFGAATLGATGCAVAASPWLGTGSVLALKAGALPPLLAMIVGPSLSLHGRATLGPANRITLARAALVGFCAGFVGDPHAESVVWELLGLHALAFFLDWVDGRVARATGSASPFGARLDMELDALFVLVLSAQVWTLGRAGAWVLASGAMRYAFVAAGWVFPWMNRPLFATPRRAWICGVQVVCLFGALVPWPVDGLSAAFAAFGLAALIYSFGADTVWLAARRNQPSP
jgi:phosphatidylglycerophosphate synthase